MSLPLAGIRVLDLTRVVAGPWCTQLLGDLGAAVWKVEHPAGGDDTRRIGPHLRTPDGRTTRESAFYLACNRNKRSLAIDVTAPEGAALVRRLAGVADVYVENSKAGSLDRLGLGAAQLRALNPRLVTCSITGFGPDGPYASRPAYDFIMQGMAGLMSTCGHPDDAPGGGPMRTAIPITDLMTGMYATVAVLGALIRRRETGWGSHVDCAMLDAAVAMNGHLALGYLMTGELPPRIGNANPVASPSAVYRSADGHLIVAAGNDRQFAALCHALARPDLLQDRRFAGNDERVRNRAALDLAIQAALKDRTTAQWIAALEAAGVPCGPINTMRELMDDPQVVHRGSVLKRPHPAGETAPMLRSPLRFEGLDIPHATPPMLGADGEDVLREVLGLDAADLDALNDAGALDTAPA